MTAASLIYLGVWCFLILVPCFLMGWIGFRFVTRLGQYPSKTALLQKSVFLPYMLVAIFSMTLILVFFKYFSSN